MTEHAGSEDTLIDGRLFWDNHSCMPLRPSDESFLPQLERYRRANVQVVTLNVGFGEQTIEQHLRMIAQFRRWVSLRTDAYRLVRSVADIEQAVREGKLELIGLSNANRAHVEEALDLVPIAGVQNQYSVLDRSSEDVQKHL
jgi:membrane dipeptidase